MQNQKRILVVEDDIEQCLQLADLLNEFGFAVAVAGDGIKALQVLETADPTPDLILLDLNMPNMDGWQLNEILKRHKIYSKIPVIIISGDEALEAVDAEGHLMKPLDVTKLRALVMQ